MGLINRLIDWATTPYTIYLILKDPAVPSKVKWRAAIGLVLMFVYIVSPFDIIPDFILFSGWLDDIIIVPLGFTLLRIFTPGMDVVEKRNRAETNVRKVLFWAVVSLVGLVLLVLAWIALLVYIIVRLITG
jgi:uncharacterized membrane protein YkvA (DUF1232 family)